jgi:uncharacterized protein (TIGR00295 family)
MSENIPTPRQCLTFLKKYNCSEEVITHCKAVRDLAVRIGKKAHANITLIEAGALLHDIGRCRTHGITHAIEGARIAHDLNLPVSIIHIIERHIGAGILKEEARQLGLPVKDYIPITLEEKIVAHADNLIEDGTKQPIEVEVQKALEKGLTTLAKRLFTLHSELSLICKINLNNI